MTTIAWRAGVMAADSRATSDTESGGAIVTRCDKLFRVRAAGGEAVVGLQGESSPGMAFLEWFRRGGRKPEFPDEASFTALVYSCDGLFEYDRYCVPERVQDRFWAIGSGAKAALGAMHQGASARQAVAIACLIDPYTAPPIRTMRLRTARARPRAAARAPG